MMTRSASRLSAPATPVRNAQGGALTQPSPNASVLQWPSPASTQQPQPQPQPQLQPQPQSAPVAAPSPSPTKSIPAPHKMVASVSTQISTARRIRWNSVALALLWITPAISSRPRELYWSFLDGVYHTFGGSADETVDAVLSWLSWALSLVLIFNLVEASILRARASAPAPAPAGGKTVAELQAAAQSLTSTRFAQFSQLRGSPKTRPTSLGPDSPLRSVSPSKSIPGTPVQDYSVFSPARSTSSPFHRISPSPRYPSASPRSRYTHTHTPDSPLAAYRASASFAKQQQDQDDSFGDESLEVDRALRSLSQSLPPARDTTNVLAR